MTRATVNITDENLEFVRQRAAEHDTSVGAELGQLLEDQIWRLRIADHGRWRRDNPDEAARLDQTATKRRTRRGKAA